jgi:hypothetical protein
VPTGERVSEFSKYDRDPSRWEWSIEPSMWFVGLSGRVKLPRSVSTGTPLPKRNIEDLNLDNPQWQPTGELNVRRGDWRGTIRGAVYNTEKNASGLSGSLGDVAFSSSDTVRSTLDFALIEIEGAYTFSGTPKERQPGGYYALDPRLDAVVGLRIYNEEWSIENLSATSGITRAEEDDWFFQPEIGLKLSTDLYRDVTVDAQITLGGLPTENTSYSFDVIVGVQWRPVENVGVQLGYRAVFFGLGSGDGESEFSFDGSLQGLYGGLVLRF